MCKEQSCQYRLCNYQSGLEALGSDCFSEVSFYSHPHVSLDIASQIIVSALLYNQ